MASIGLINRGSHTESSHSNKKTPTARAAFYQYPLTTKLRIRLSNAIGSLPQFLLFTIFKIHDVKHEIYQQARKIEPEEKSKFHDVRHEIYEQVRKIEPEEKSKGRKLNCNCD